MNNFFHDHYKEELILKTPPAQIASKSSCTSGNAAIINTICLFYPGKIQIVPE